MSVGGLVERLGQVHYFASESLAARVTEQVPMKIDWHQNRLGQSIAGAQPGDDGGQAGDVGSARRRSQCAQREPTRKNL